MQDPQRGASVRTFAFAAGVLAILGGMACIIDIVSSSPGAPERLSATPPTDTRANPAPTDAATLGPTAVAPASRVDRLKIQIGLMVRAVQARDPGASDSTWSGDRREEARIAGRPISEDALVLEIEARKTLLYQLWRQASLHAVGQQFLRPEDIDAGIAGMMGPAGERPPATPALAAPVPGLGDLQSSPDDRRCLLSLAMEAVVGTGLFAGKQLDLLPWSLAAGDRLAAVAAFVTSPFLIDCGRFAAHAGHDQVQAEDVQSAFAAVIDRLGVSDASPPPAPTRPAEIDADLLFATRQLIGAAITSLQESQMRMRMSGDDPVEQQRWYLNRYLSIPCDAAGFAQLRQRLRMLADSVALGVAPLSPTVFSGAAIANPRALDDHASALQRHAFADLPWTMQLLDEAVPSRIRSGSGMSMRLVPVPGIPLSRTGAGPEVLSPREIRLQDSDLEGVSNSGIGWSLIQEAWASPHAQPADPSALNVLDSRMSELALLILRACDGEAKERGERVIDRRLCDLVMDGFQIAAAQGPEPGWPLDPGKLSTLKAAAFRGIFLAPFLDAAKGSGFPETIQVPRADGADLRDGTVTSLVDVTGSGIAVGDVDGDGLPDLFLVGDGGNRLMRNLGNGRFQDVTQAYGITDTRLDDAHQALFVDYDNDGRLDLFIVHAHSPSRLFHQKPDGHFEDVSSTCGIVTGADAHDAVWFDYDNDGLLDCYVGSYGSSHPTLDGRNGGGNRLFHNLGNGRFEDVTQKSGMGSTGWTLAMAACDFSHDGRQDVFIANDYGRNELYHNNGDGTFTEIGHAAGVDDRGGSRCASLIDLDNDGWLGLFVSQIDLGPHGTACRFPVENRNLTVNQRILGATITATGPRFYRNRHDGTFAPSAHESFEPGGCGWAWSANFFDFANAGQDDCYMTNGWLDGTPAAGEPHQFFIANQGRYLLWNRGGAQSYRSNARGCIAADLLGDGRMDLVVNDYGGPPHLLLNTSRNGNHWIKIRLHGVHANRQGIGATVQVAAGQLGQWKAVSCGSNYLSQEDTTLTFGLGAHEHVDAIDVVWPGSHHQHLAGPIPVDQLTVVTESPISPADH